MSDIRKFKIYVYGAKIIRTVCKKAEHGSDEAIMVSEELKAVCRTLGAAGMAANQLGHDLSICCVRTNDGEHHILINPKITGNLLDSIRRAEACYSIPGFTASITRSERGVDVEYIDEEGEKKRATFRGLEARYLQHECDHLDGILVCDQNKIFGREKLKRIYRKFVKQDFFYSINELGEMVT